MKRLVMSYEHLLPWLHDPCAWRCQLEEDRACLDRPVVLRGRPVGVLRWNQLASAYFI